MKRPILPRTTKRWGRRAWGRAALAIAMPLCSSALYAGPPFVADDPEPTDAGHWEIYNFVRGTHVAGATTGQAGIDLNYGPIEDVQLTAVIPADYTTGSAPLGWGDVELAVKYRFLHPDEASTGPDVAFFPRLFVPTAPTRFGSRRLGLLLPLWAQTDRGTWSIFGGGGYQINPGAGQRSFAVSAVGIQNAISPQFTLGAEVYHQSPSLAHAKPFTGANLGATYRVSTQWSLLSSTGPGLQNAATMGQWAFYVALKADY